MGPKGSLPYSQEPAAGLYPEPDESGPHHPVSLRLILLLSSHLRLGLPNGLFTSVLSIVDLVEGGTGTVWH
jgi:hypothetical protein